MHGTLKSYTHRGCRCDNCRQAMSVYHKKHTPSVVRDRVAMRNLLIELFPCGLTHDCPARKQNLEPANPKGPRMPRTR